MSKIRLISFDCYGTLIDWKKGVTGALRPLLDDYFITMDDEQVFRLFAEIDEDMVTAGFRPYREVLTEIMRRFAAKLNINMHPEDLDILVRSLPGWEPFGDTVEALREMKSKNYRLAIISNTDKSLIGETLKLLDIGFDMVITSEELGSYKPSPENFLEALRRFRQPADEIIHAAQSRFHDIIPARDLGISTAWINRYNEPVPPMDEEYAGMRFPDLRSFVAGLSELEGC